MTERPTSLRPLQPAAVPAGAPNPLEVSVLIVTWNSARWIRKCLGSIEAAVNGLRHEIIVLDNASADGTVQIVKSLDIPTLSLIEATTNLGFAGAMNKLVAAASGEFLLSLNADSEPEPYSIERLVEHLRTNPAVAAAAPLLSHDDGASQSEWQLRKLPSIRSVAAEVLLLNKLFPRNRWAESHGYRSTTFDDVQHVEQPAGAAILFRRTAMDAVGEFDESFSPAWFEDVDYCRRMADAGLRIEVVPTARARHVGGVSLEQMSFEEFIVIWYRNLHRYASKWFPRSQSEMVRWMIIVGMVVRIFASASFIVRPPVPRLAAIRGYRRVLREALARWSGTSRSSS